MKPHYSYKYLLLLLCIILLVFRFFIDPVNMLTWDVFGYYLYLPANFIYSDPGLANPEWLTHLVSTYEPTSTLYQIVEGENGNRVIKYTMGLSILYAPFFFIAHCLAEWMGYPANGLSLPYQYSITLGGLIYAMIGLIFFSKVLLHFFNKRIAALLLVIVFFGTNYFHLTIYDGTLLSHNFLFTFYAILTFYTIQWYKENSLKNAIIIGLSVGFITLIRPSEGICILIPILWSNSSDNYFKHKFDLLKKYYLHLFIVAICVFAVLTPQLLYWNSITGKYLFYSYQNAGEGLDFTSPHTFNFLFSFRKGWFIYTPIMVFAFVGLVSLYKRNKPIFFTVAIFILLDIYISSSWTTWWYAGGSFSSRSLVPAYVLLAIPMGYFIKSLESTKSKIILSTIGILLIALNLFQSWQFENGIISKERMTMDYYFAIFGKTHVEEDDEKKLLVNRSVTTFEDFENTDNYQSRVLYQNSFDETSNEQQAFVLDNTNSFSPGIDIPYKELTTSDHAWVKGSARLFIPTDYSDQLPLFIATFHYKGEPYKYRSFELEQVNLKYNDWNDIEFYYLTPEVRSKEDNLKVYLWHRGQQKVLLDDLVIQVFEPKNE